MPRQVGWQQEIRNLGNQAKLHLVQSQYVVGSELVQSCSAIGAESVNSSWQWYAIDEDFKDIVLNQ